MSVELIESAIKSFHDYRVARKYAGVSLTNHYHFGDWEWPDQKIKFSWKGKLLICLSTKTYHFQIDAVLHTPDYILAKYGETLPWKTFDVTFSAPEKYNARIHVPELTRAARKLLFATE